MMIDGLPCVLVLVAIYVMVCPASSDCTALLSSGVLSWIDMYVTTKLVLAVKPQYAYGFHSLVCRSSTDQGL